MELIQRVRVRIDRAVKHINEFGLVSSAYLRESPFATRTESYTENGKEGLRFFFQVNKKLPPSLGVIAGDSIHNLRASLDNIVWALGKVYPSTDTSADANRLAFPVCDTAEQYENTLRRREYKAITNFPSEAQQLIESLQPYYSTPEGFRLSILHALWNADKHRSPDLMAAVPNGISMKGFDLQAPAEISAGWEIYDGREFAHGILPDAGIAADAKVELLDIAICFHESGPAANFVAFAFLEQLLHMVNNIVTRFEPYFPSESQSS